MPKVIVNKLTFSHPAELLRLQPISLRCQSLPSQEVSCGWHTVARDCDDAVIIRNLKDRIVAWNKGAQSMYGYTEAEALGMKIERIIPKNRHVRTREWVRLFAERKKVSPAHIVRRMKDGRTVDVLLTVSLLRDDKGQPVAIATTEHDIAELRHADREFRKLHGRVIAAQEIERKRIGRELHDGVGGMLAGTRFALESLTETMTLSREAQERILKVSEALQHAVAEIRRVAHNLMPSELYDLGLVSALLTLCREFEERTRVRVTAKAVPTGASREMELVFYRIAQEAFHNIEKHSKATKVVLSLSREGDEVILNVSDNGTGFKLRKRSKVDDGIGLRTMRDRAESIGGSLEMQSKPGAGTALSIRAPLTG